MWVETPNSTPEVQQTQPEAPKMPNEHPEKKWLFAEISDMLRKLSDSLGLSKFFGNENPDKKTNWLQEFMANMLASFQGIDIEKGVTLRTEGDVQKVREALRPIIDLDETGIIFKSGDFIRYNKNTGTVDFYPADKNNPSGHSTEMSGTVTVGPRKLPIKTPEQVEAEYESAVNNHAVKPQESSNFSTAVSNQLGRWLSQRGTGASTGPNSCGTAVDALLTEFGIKNVTPWHGRHGNRWHGFLEKDPRFKKIEVNSLADIPPGAILTFSGKWRLNGKPNGSAMNQKYWHVEIKADNGLFYSFWHAARNPGGSAREPQLHNNFAKWKEATGFTGAYVPIATTKAEANKIRNSGELDNQATAKPAENRNFNEKEFINTQLETLRKKGLKSGETAIIVSSQTQKTYLVKENGDIIKSYISSTGAKGMGNQTGSNKTPTGTLKIHTKVGAGQPKMMSFEWQQPKWVVPLATKDTDNDAITSRILTVAGMDSGNKNALARGIFFHGTNEEFLLGKPASHGCIRMKNDDIIEMFDLVKTGTLVQIA